jgi:hypothetical protein
VLRLRAINSRDQNVPVIVRLRRLLKAATRFVSQYGDQSWELEALDPKLPQRILRDVIDSVIDADAFNHELQEEKQDAGFLKSVRNTVRDGLAKLKIDS